jgi:5'-3' exonuclease
VRVHLVDGTYELFRCFHGAPRAAGRDGAEVGAARGMFATMAALLREPDVTHVAVAFDSVIAPAGLTKEKATKEPLGAQVPLAAQVVRALGITVWPSGRFQADELLASGAARYRHDPRVDRVVICTTDLDLAQTLEQDRVELLDRSRRISTDEAAVRARFGVAPAQLPDLFALVGDRSDGIAGVPGFGLRSAAALVQTFGCVDDIPVDPATWPAIRGKDRLAISLTRWRREALHGRDLLRLRDDAPVRDSVDDLEWHGAHRDEVDAVVELIDAPELADGIPRFAN